MRSYRGPPDALRAREDTGFNAVWNGTARLLVRMAAFASRGAGAPPKVTEGGCATVWIVLRVFATCFSTRPKRSVCSGLQNLDHRFAHHRARFWRRRQTLSGFNLDA
jgi:hypothetical protein